MITHQPSGQSGISLWTAEFLDPFTEAAYRKRNAGFNIRHTRFGLGLWGVLLILFIYNDYINLGPVSGFWILFAMRLTVSAVILVFTVVIGRHPGLVMNGHGIAGLLVFGWTGFFLIFFFLPISQMPWIIAMVMAMLIGQFVFIPNRVVTGLAAALYAMIGTMISVYLVAGSGPSELVGLFLMLLVPTGTGLFVCGRFQLEHRRSFAMLLAAESANAELQRQIRAREELEKKLKEQAETDPLTGLYNRRRYETMFIREFQRIKRYGGPMSVLVLDLDHFKRVNDTYGHSAGDVVLQEVAALCRRQLRQVDIIGRLGGEEFVIMLPDTGISDAMTVAERLRKEIESTEIVTDRNRLYITATIGAAEIVHEDQGIEDLVRRADAALYRGKQEGRNRVEAAQQSN
ncbi:MAG: GGDEF domain-containing protein [Desulfobacteraceae bacterium]|nr:GGDEF domain-containing protein [Desulfobacteraceae bacterium]